MTVTSDMEGIEPLVAMDGAIEKQEQQQHGNSDMKKSPSPGSIGGDKKRLRNGNNEQNGEKIEDEDIENNDKNDQDDRKEEKEEEAEEEIVIAAYASPANVVLQRDFLTAEAIDAEIKALQGMWEMASILDFFHLFRKQLKLTRHFAASELERVLVTSPGDTGLLADVHIDLMRGISPKNEISTANWQIHLANKIKFHWRNLNDGTVCPFKPEKYLEAISYAELPAAYRVRALHFLCCIRLDREDIGLRMFEAERPKTEAEMAEIEAAQEAARLRASRSTRSSRVTTEDSIETELLDTLDTFRREPTGFDSSGAAYYYFDHVETTGFRVYKEIVVDPNKKSAHKDKDNTTNNDDDDDLSPEDLEREAAERAAAESKMGRKRRERALRKMPLVKSKYALRDHPKPKPWKLVANTLEELVALGEGLAFGEASLEADKTLGQLILEEFVPQLQEKAEAEEKKRRAAERVRSRLGVGNDRGQGGGGGDSYYGRDSNGGGSNTAGGGTGGGDKNAAVGGVNGRSRRARTQVNYAFNEYDLMLKSAIRRSQKGGRDDSPSGLVDQDGGGGGGGRRSRRGGSPVILTGEEAAMLGLRRGRSHTTGGMYGVDSGTELNERALRQQRAERNPSPTSGGGVYRSDTDASQLDMGGTRGGTGNAMRGGSYEPQSSGGGGSGNGRGRGGGGRSRLAPKYARDYVTDGGGTEDSDGPSYVARPTRKRGRPAKATSAAGAAGGGDVAVQNRKAVEGIPVQNEKQDADIVNQVAAAEKQQQQQQQQAQALLAQRQQVVQRIQHIQMLQAQSLPIPPDQVQFLTMLNQYQQQRQQQQLSQQGVDNAAAAAPVALLPSGGVFSSSVINQSFAGIPTQQPQQQQQGFPHMGNATTASGGMIPVPTAPGAPAAMMSHGYQGPAQQPTYLNQNVDAAGVFPAPAAPQQQQQEEAGNASFAQWGGSGKRTQPTSKRAPPPP